jgi:drug/metabolite transporter (DMT)-like permease
VQRVPCGSIDGAGRLRALAPTKTRASAEPDGYTRPSVSRPAISLRLKTVIAFALVYIFWGSTYLGIRVAVERVPPILMAGVRFSAAGIVLLAYCALSGRQVTLTREQFRRLAIVGVLLLSIANAVLAWAELHVPTGLAALIISVSPIWFLLIERYVVKTGEGVGHSGVAGIGLGILGMFVLLWPRLTEVRTVGWLEGFAALSLLGSSFSWALGSVLARTWRLTLDPLVGAGWQMMIAGTLNVVVGLLLGEHRAARWDAAGIGAIVYLMVFGSWVAYSAYIWLLRHVPTAKVATYAYVNPIVAVFLGWLLLHERIDGFMVAGTAVILPAVALVTRAETRTAGSHPD